MLLWGFQNRNSVRTHQIETSKSSTRIDKNLIYTVTWLLGSINLSCTVNKRDYWRNIIETRPLHVSISLFLQWFPTEWFWIIVLATALKNTKRRRQKIVGQELVGKAFESLTTHWSPRWLQNFDEQLLQNLVALISRLTKTQRTVMTDIT